jgi:Na+-transporting NADH:ubiquinone oxidoreductase subunit A
MTAQFSVERGFDVVLPGTPDQLIDAAAPVRHVGVLGRDYQGLKPTLKVAVDDRVRLGDVLFTDRRDTRLQVTSPASGIISAIERGERRSLECIVIAVDGDESVHYPAFNRRGLRSLDRQDITGRLLESGLWAALRMRPFNRIPSPDTAPRWLFVTAIDTNPHAADPAVVIEGNAEAFSAGVAVLSRLATETTYVCHALGAEIPVPDEQSSIQRAEFAGPHPAGLPGTHIHHLATVDIASVAWHIGYQDVIAAGQLFVKGRLTPGRVIALGGSGTSRPRLLRTRLGARLSELLRDDMLQPAVVHAGSPLMLNSNRRQTEYLGRYDLQVTLIDSSEVQTHSLYRRPASLLGPLAWRFRKSQRLTPRLSPPRPHQGFVPVEAFERVWPFAIPPAPLLRALLGGDTETAEALGCLELAPEDLALCTLLCPAHHNYGRALNRVLDSILGQV